MRFVSIILLLVIGFGYAVSAGSQDEPTISRGLLAAPDGYKVEKLQQRLPKISALTMVGNDLYATAKDGQSIIKLGDRDGDEKFDARSTYLIGFSGLSDIVGSSSHLYIADSNGVWRAQIGRGLVAATAPTQILALTNSNSKLAFDASANRLFVSSSGKIIVVDLNSNTARTIDLGDLTATALAVSPHGGLWAALTQNGTSYITPIRAGSSSTVKLELTAGSTVSDLMFWPKESFPEAWPDEWRNNLFISLDGDQPMIGRARFNFGDIEPKVIPFITGFSAPSRIVGRRDILAVPGSMSTFARGRLIFAQKDAGRLWTLQKAPNLPAREFVSTPNNSVVLKIEETAPIAALPIIRGSSITNASTLKNGSALENDDLLRAPAKPEQNKENLEATDSFDKSQID